MPFILLVLLAIPGSSLAQTRLVSSRNPDSSQTLLRHRRGVLAPAQASGISPVLPPNTSDSWTGGGDGTSWNSASNWNNGIPNSSTVDVTIGTPTAAVNDNLNNAQIANLTLSNAGDGLTLGNGIVLNVFGPSISNAGTMTLGSTGSFTELVLQGNTTLSGGGTLTLSNNIQNYIFGAATADTLTNQSTIQGAGQIGHGQMTLVNSGTINANQSAGMVIQANGGVTNTGTIKATGGTLEFLSTTTNNTGGTISANANTLQLVNSTINGGAVTLTGAATLQMNSGTIHGSSTLTNSATGTIEALAGTNTLGGTVNNSAGGTFKIDNGAVMNLEAGTYSQLGTVQLNSTGSFTELVLQGNVTLSGGTLTLSNNIQNYIFGHATTDVLTNQETIQGAGQIGNSTMGLINSGSILANQSAGITIQTSSAGFTNTGTLGVSTGDLMHVLGGPFTNFSGSTLTGGTYSVSGTLQIDELGTTGGEIVTNAAKIILNGTGSSFVDQSNKDALSNLSSNTATGAFTVSGGRNFTTAGNFSNLGTLTVGNGSAFTVTGTLAQISGSTLSGGTFILGGNLNVGSGINITTNSSTLTLQGGTIMSGATNALAGLNKNTKSLTLAGNANFTTAANFTNTGTLAVNSGSTFAVNGSLTNYNGTTKTLTGGTYTVGGTLSAAGLDIVTDAANITLSGTGKLVNSTNSANALANLTTISSTGSLTLASNANFTAATNFTNSGKLTVNSGSTFGVTGTLTNLSAGTLTGGTYTVGGTMQLAAANGGITTNAANLTLTGAAAKIMDGTTNALAGFNNNTGTFALASAAKLTTAASNFTNSGTVTVAKGTTLTVGGTGNSYNQSAGTTTVDGTLVGAGATGISVTGGKIQGAGTLKTNVSIGGSGTTPTINVGDAGKAGLLSITGTYTQLATGTMNVSIGGTTVGTQYSQLKITGAASLGGTLTAGLINGFTPTVGQTFTVLTASSVTGKFSNSTIAINSTEHFVVSYTSTSVVLTVASGPVGSSNNVPAAPVSQTAMASTSQSMTIAKAPILFSSARHKIGGTVKTGKPVLFSGLKRGGGAIIARGLDRNSLSTSLRSSTLAGWNRAPGKLSQAASVSSMRQLSIGRSSMRSGLVASQDAGGMRLGLGARPILAGELASITNRRATPIRMLPTRMPMMRSGR
jgi:hypothetical protein